MPSYRRITPVSVVLIPTIDSDGRQGCVVGERGIEPQLGQFALPGGFIEFGETAENGAIREVMEETGFAVADLRFIRSDPTPHGLLLMFFRARLVMEAGLEFRSSIECPSYKIIYQPEELAFPLHTKIIEEYFHGLKSVR